MYENIRVPPLGPMTWTELLTSYVPDKTAVSEVSTSISALLALAGCAGSSGSISISSSLLVLI